MMKPANGQNRVQRHPAEYKVVILDLSRCGGRCGCRRKNSYKRATGGITTDQSPYSALNQSHLLLNISSKMEMMAPSMCTDILISQFFNIFFLLKKFISIHLLVCCSVFFLRPVYCAPLREINPRVYSFSFPTSERRDK